MVHLLINHEHIIEDIVSLIKLSCFPWIFHQVKLNHQRCAKIKTHVPMLCWTTLPMVQPLGGFVEVTYTFPMAPIPTASHFLILEIPIRYHLVKLIHFWLDPYSLKCNKLKCYILFYNSYFDAIPLGLKTNSWYLATLHTWGYCINIDCTVFN